MQIPTPISQNNPVATGATLLLSNPHCRAYFTTMGAALLSFQIKKGDDWIDLICGEKDPAFRESHPTVHNALVGRVANRISGASFTLDDQVYSLDANEGSNQLHSGLSGFHRYPWELVDVNDHEIIFTFKSPDGASGFPGTVSVKVTYTLIDTTLTLRIQAEADQPTPFNPTHHNYWRLNPATETIQDHSLWLDSRRFLETSSDLIPTGNLKDLQNTPFDCTSLTGEPLSTLLSKLAKDGTNDGGLDTYFVLEHSDSQKPKARVFCPSSGISLNLYTDLPGLQIYTCQQGETLPSGAVLPPYYAICLEPSGFPDAVNHPNFPSVILRPGEVYDHFIRFEITV